jgi:hypothetical protein
MAISLDQSFQVSSIVTLILWLKVLYSNVMLGGAKMKAGKRAPEDVYQIPQDKAKPDSLAEVDRTQRIVNNDLENIPYGLITAWTSLFCIYRNSVADPGLLTAHVVLMVVFGAMRVGHTIAYRFALSYARSFLWTIGVLSVIGLGIIGIIASF